MFGWFKIKSPLNTEQRRWIKERFEWLHAEFGAERLTAPTVTPTEEYFPDPYAGTVEDASVLFDRVCKYMGVDRARIDLRFYESASADVVAAAFNPVLPREYALGAYQEHDGRIDIWLETTSLREPGSVVATLAHELGHVHLLADGRCHETAEDHEPLTDLLVVYFGLGIFVANNTLHEVNWNAGQFSGWQMSKRGYMSLAEHAYALALYAHARNEHAPRWAKYLRKDVRALFEIDLRHLVRGTELHVVNPKNDVTTDTDSTDKSNPSDYELDSGAEGGASNEPVAEFNDAEPSEELATDASADDFFTEGVNHATQAEHDLAITAFTQALRLNPTDVEAWLYRARSNLAIARYTQAIEDCTACLRLKPTAVGAACYRAMAHLWLRRFADAIPDLDRAIRADKSDANAWQLRGLAHIGLKQFQEAIHDLNQAVRRAPTWATNYLARSRAHDGLGDVKRAQADLNEAIRRDSNLSDDSQRSACLAGRS
jgi:tetratricopeptide (TPR) repeat protein